MALTVRSGLTAALAILAAATALAACTNPPGQVPSTPPTTTAPLPGPPGQLSVLSYNVAGLPQEVSKVNPRAHIPLISPLLNDYDVVLTQEDFDWWQPILNGLDFVHYHDRLRAQAIHPYRSGQHPGPIAVGLDLGERIAFVGDGLGMLSRYPFTELDRVPWPLCFGGAFEGAGDCFAMKGFSRTTMTLTDGKQVDVYNVHGEAGGTPIDQQLQAQGFDLMADWIVNHSAGRAVILAGDTNLHTDPDHPDADGLADTQIWEDLLARTGLADVCNELSCQEPGSIDKVAYRDGGGVDLTALSHDMPTYRFRSPTGEDLSDHPPVVVQFRWE